MLQEKTRSSLYEKLAADYGEEEASAVVETVAAYHRSEIASKQDVQLATAELRAEIATLAGELRAEIAAVKDEIHDAGRNVIVWTIPTMATLTAMSFVAARMT